MIRPLPPQADPGKLLLAPQVRPHPVGTPRALMLLAATDRPGALSQRADSMSARDALLRQFFGGLSA